MIESVSVSPTKPSTLFAPTPFPNQRPLTQTSSSPIRDLQNSCPPAIRATGTPKVAVPATDPTETCAREDHAPTVKASTASFRCGCATGCRRARGTAANACASPSALRAGGREPADVRALPTATSRVATIGPTESIPGKVGTALQGAAEDYIAIWPKGAAEAVPEAAGTFKAHVDDDEDYEFTT
ncbi:hypothetical protein O988_08188 [Pseudogymnoascus sp. VKM F-3808]|nr:hypothetical protein O988_08188 [Pseudogymnoascus sp. VKM F-3808]